MVPAVTQAGRLIEDFLARKKMTRSQLAAKLDFSAGYLTMLMKGERAISLNVAQELARATDISIDRWQQDRPLHGSMLTGIGVLADWRIEKAEREGLLKISPFRGEGDESRLQAASYDLSRGEFKAPKEALWNTTKESLKLAPNSSVLVRTVEEITLSKRVVGRIAPQGELVLHYVTLSFGLHLDPGWKGKPFMHLHNHGADTFCIDYDQCIASVEFHLLADDPNSVWLPPEQEAKQI